MNTLTSKADGRTYQLINAEKSMPIAYNEKTNEKVIAAIERARINRQRIRIYLGDTETGKCWNEEHNIMGYVGLSKGYEAYFPILVYNERSYGGGSLMDDCIIKIKEAKGGYILYQSKNFQQPNIEVKESKETGYTHSVYVEGELYSNHKTERAAILLKNKLI